MIVNFATAKHISGLMLDISRRLDESIALLRGTCSPEKIQSVSTRNGKSLAKILLEMLNPLYSKHTSLRLSELKGPESVL